MFDIAGQRLEALRVLGLPANAHGEQGAAMKAVDARHDAVLARVFEVAHAARQLECRLIGLGAGITEEHALGKGVGHQFLRQLQGRLIGQHVGHVPQLLRLLGDRCNQCGMRVS